MSDVRRWSSFIIIFWSVTWEAVNAFLCPKFSGPYNFFQGIVLKWYLSEVGGEKEVLGRMGHP